MLHRDLATPGRQVGRWSELSREVAAGKCVRQVVANDNFPMRDKSDRLVTGSGKGEAKRKQKAVHLFRGDTSGLCSRVELDTKERHTRCWQD